MKAIWLACCACGDYGLLQREVEGRDAGAQVLRVGDLDGLVSMARAFPSRRGAAIIAASLFDTEDVRKTVARLTAEGRVSRVVVLIEALDPSDIEGLFRAGATEVIAAHSICGNGRAGEGAVDSDRRMTIEPDAFVDREPGAPRATRGPRVDDYGKAEAEHGRRPRNPLVYDDAGGPAQHAGDSPAVDMGYVHGVNLADEYINQRVRFGHWKDTAVMIKGKAVDSFTMMFLQLWDVTERDGEEYRRFLCPPEFHMPEGMDYGGFVMPYADSPLDGENVGESVYLDILGRSRRYVHITTPYLILDDTTLAALKFAAKRGVEVIIIMPHIPDKLYAYLLARSYYAELLRSGVQIYEYTPGFIHAKMFTSDDEKAVVGTINLDFRSLYLHFECASYFFRNAVVMDVEEDFQKTLAKSERITLENCRKYPFIRRFAGKALRILAPLM